MRDRRHEDAIPQHDHHGFVDQKVEASPSPSMIGGGTNATSSRRSVTRQSIAPYACSGERTRRIPPGSAMSREQAVNIGPREAR